MKEYIIYRISHGVRKMAYHTKDFNRCIEMLNMMKKVNPNLEFDYFYEEVK